MPETETRMSRYHGKDKQGDLGDVVEGLGDGDSAVAASDDGDANHGVPSSPGLRS